MAAPSHRAPDNLLGGVWNVSGLIDQRRILAAEFEQYGRQVFRRRFHYDLADLRAAGEKDEIEGKFQKLGDLFPVPHYGGHRALIKIAGYKFHQPR